MPVVEIRPVRVAVDHPDVGVLVGMAMPGGKSFVLVVVVLVVVAVRVRVDGRLVDVHVLVALEEE